MTDLLTIADCAARGRVSVSTIKREIRAGKLRTIKVRGRVRITPADWEEYIRTCRSALTVKVGRFGFSTPTDGLAKLLGIRERSCVTSEIVELSVAREKKRTQREEV